MLNIPPIKQVTKVKTYINPTTGINTKLHNTAIKEVLPKIIMQAGILTSCAEITALNDEQSFLGKKLNTLLRVGDKMSIPKTTANES